MHVFYGRYYESGYKAKSYNYKFDSKDFKYLLRSESVLMIHPAIGEWECE